MLQQLLFREIFVYRSSCPEAFCKKGVLRNFTKFIGKHLCQSLFFNKVADLRPTTLLKKGLWHRYFPVNFAKFLRTLFFIEHLWWLLLCIVFFFLPLNELRVDQDRTEKWDMTHKWVHCPLQNLFLFLIQLNAYLFTEPDVIHLL